ncbi:ribosome silencing factor [Natribacillus halophilus]|uniref:Ribosomal silencing factor RsfS n=1 Tax=Natribacillus halophilus TaxID=549003 RepID=A0A1G8JVZ0_9BACI|nr:ribosome silencing factor [Natribacillus halophilus]SDI34750.1 ribosome-associated protein [Natribacillus halophilus]
MTYQTLETMVKVADDKRAQNIVALDMQGISILADYFVICHGASVQQVQSIAEEIKKEAQKKEIDVKRMEGYEEGKWVLLDLGNVVIHIFHEDDRQYYNLEKLWGEAPVISLDHVLT